MENTNNDGKKKYVVGIFVLFVLFIVIAMQYDYFTEKREKALAEEIAAEKRKLDEEKKLAEERLKERERNDFINNIDSHYIHLIEAYKENNFENVLEMYAAFTKHSQADYKDLKSIIESSKEQIKLKRIDELEIIVKDIPVNQFQRNLEIYAELKKLNPNKTLYAEKYQFYSQKIAQQRIRDQRIREGLVWRYSSFIDSMTNKEGQNALVNSLNLVNFSSPYAGPQRGLLQLRLHPRYGKDVIFSLEKGQILCRHDGCNVLVRFGNNAPVSYRAAEPADHSTTHLFIRNYDSFLKNLQKVDLVSIEVPFYKEGNHVFQFDVSELDWP